MALPSRGMRGGRAAAALAGRHSASSWCWRSRGTRAFSSEVDTGSREENASKQRNRAPFRFHRNGKGSRRRRRRTMADRINLTIDNGVADVRLNRADKMNALDPAMFTAIAETGARLKQDKCLRAVVLSGEG